MYITPEDYLKEVRKKEVIYFNYLEPLPEDKKIKFIQDMIYLDMKKDKTIEYVILGICFIGLLLLQVVKGG